MLSDIKEDDEEQNPDKDCHKDIRFQDLNTKSAEGGASSHHSVSAGNMLDCVSGIRNADIHTRDESTVDDTVLEVQIENENKNVDSDSEEIEVTRIVVNQTMPDKDIPHLNSTENLFSEYDPAMTYIYDTCNINGERGSRMSKSAEKLNPTDNHKSNVNQQQYAPDDSVSNTLPSTGKGLLSRRVHKSEGNLLEILARSPPRNRRTTSTLRLVRSGSIKWDFHYISPYAMSEKEKSEMLARKERMRIKKKNAERLLKEAKERRERENTAVFEAWKRKKFSERQEKVFRIKHGLCIGYDC